MCYPAEVFSAFLSAFPVQWLHCSRGGMNSSCARGSRHIAIMELAPTATVRMAFGHEMVVLVYRDPVHVVCPPQSSRPPISRSAFNLLMYSMDKLQNVKSCRTMFCYRFLFLLLLLLSRFSYHYYYCYYCCCYYYTVVVIRYHSIITTIL